MAGHGRPGSQSLEGEETLGLGQGACGRLSWEGTVVRTPSGGDAQGDGGGQGHMGEPTACAEACGRRRPGGFQAMQRGHVARTEP